MSNVELFNEIGALDDLKVVADSYKKDEMERRRIDTEMLRTQLDLAKEQLANNAQDREDRKAFSRKLFKFTQWYLIGVGLLLLISIYVNCGIDSSVLIALLTTTTANIIGLFLTVTKYLFSKK